MSRNTAALAAYESPVAARIRRLEDDRFVPRLSARDASLWSPDATVQAAISGRLGWLDAPARMAAAADELAALADEVRQADIRDIVLLGMGGSSLAPRVFADTLAAPGWPRLTVLDTTDPATVLSAERSLDLTNALFVVASKSGATVEVSSLFACFYERAREATGDAVGDSFVAITDDGTPLQALARQYGFRRVFVNPPDIGGRFSALSYFGLVPAALAGADVRLLLRRALAMAEACAPGVPARDNPGVWLGAALGELALSGRDKLTLVLPPSLASLGAWVEQLIAESTGKDGRGILPVDAEPLGEPSVYGDDRVFVRVALNGDAASERALERLARAGHPVIRLGLENAYDLGAEFVRWEIATSTAGAVIGINPFDEPNVAESKTNTQRLLDEYSARGSLPNDEPSFFDSAVSVFAEADTSRTLREALGSFVRQVRRGDYLAFLAYLPETAPTQRTLQSIRLALRDATKATTTVGFGPRYLHSTGQLHKGGGDNGHFLLLTADDVEDVPVPGQPYTLGMLKRAQALGDLAALRRHGRRVLRLHLAARVEAGLDQLAAAAKALRL